MRARKKTRRTGPDSARDRILAASLPHVVFDGWTAKALAAGARDSGLGEAGLARAFPGGPKDAALHFGAWADGLMMGAVGNQFRRRPMRTHERVAAALRIRLRVLAPHREAVRRLLGFLALPNNAGVATRMLWRSADAIWRLAGDTATDFNYYTKRGMLAGVYASTLLFWLSDESEDFADTEAFMDRRIGDVMKIFAIRGRLRGLADGVSLAGRIKDALDGLGPLPPPPGPVRDILRRAARVVQGRAGRA
ncbi:MAG: COQ9 family protein [Alphaproteobacteria bacterium]|nr:COQ9 family protein [Alphaproteobacteria bacterium]